MCELSTLAEITSLSSVVWKKKGHRERLKEEKEEEEKEDEEEEEEEENLLTAGARETTNRTRFRSRLYRIPYAL